MSGQNLLREAAGLLDAVRTRRPRVHCLMNGVVQKLVADGLSAIGAVPSMTGSPDEIGHFAGKADALLVNLGTLDEARRQVIALGVDSVAEEGKPWVLDPAHCDYSPPRARYAIDLMECGPVAVRGNGAEMTLLDVPETVIAVETGLKDTIAGAGRRVTVRNGHALSPVVTGTGCLSGALLAAFAAVADEPFVSAVAATLVAGVAAEKAGAVARGPGSFEPALLDALFALTPNDIETSGRLGDG